VYNGSAISWVSSDEGYVTSGGTVTRPAAGEGDAWVEMTARADYGSASMTKTFYLTVKNLGATPPLTYHEFDGHYYAVVQKDVNWFDALAEASTMTYNGRPGTLASIDFEEENDFVTGIQDLAGYWLGGYQIPGSEEPAGGWYWANGNHIYYDHWNQYEPNNSGDENAIEYGDSAGNWSDISAYNTGAGYVVEFGSFPLSAEDMAYADKDALQIGFAPGENSFYITQDITLPSTGYHGSVITWDSENTSVIDNTGHVTRPVYSDGNAWVRMAATVENDGVTCQKYFYLIVVRTDPGDSEADQAMLALEELEIGFAGSDSYYSVTQNITLPTAGPRSSTVIWSSGDSGIVQTDGTVTRPSYSYGGNAGVYLNAALTLGSTTLDRQFYIVVLRNDPSSSDEDCVYLDYETLQIGYAEGENEGYVTQNITLPTDSANGCTIQWYSYNESIVGTDGTVTRPEYYQGNQQIEIYARITKGEVSYNKWFYPTVIRNDPGDSDYDLALLDYEALEIGYTEGDSVYSVTQDITLPTTGDNGSTIVWHSYNTDVIATDGTVTRPSYYQGNYQVSLYASISKGDAYYEKWFYPYVICNDFSGSESDCVALERNNLEIGYAEGDYQYYVTHNITLPTNSDNGCTITWHSNNESVVATDGTVTRPPYYAGTAYINVYATITKGDAYDEKWFNLYVVRNDPADIDGDNAFLDKEELQIGYATGDYYYSVTQNLSLPVSGSHGSTITWASNYPDIVASDGTVTRPSYSSYNYSVYLTATVTKGSMSFTKSFNVTVLKSDTPVSETDKAYADYLALAVGYNGTDSQYSVTQNLTLPATGTYGSTITWSSGNTSYLANDGTITRPPYYQGGNAYVYLYATITNGSASYSNYWRLAIVRADPTSSDADCAYLDYENLQVGFASGDDYGSVTQNITLPSSGTNGSTITWYIPYPQYIGSDGTITRPSYITGDVYLYIYGYVQKGTSQTYSRYFYLTVKKADLSTDADRVYADWNALQVGYASGDYSSYVTGNLTLDTLGDNGSTIAWTSSAPDVIAEDGTVTRPTYAQGDASVNLTATVSIGAEQRTKTFSMYVIRNAATDSQEDLAMLDQEALQITYATGDSSGSVTQNLTLPASGTHGSTITWASSNEATVTSSGVVTRPSYTVGNAAIVMTATLTNGSAVLTKTFNITVAFDPMDDHGYNFATASDITVGTPMSGNYDYSYDYDYYKFTAGATGNYTVRSISGMDTYGYLYDENGNLIESDDDDGEGANFMITRDLQEGHIYYVATRPYYSSGRGAYQVLVAFTSASDPDSVTADYNALQITYASGDNYSSVTQNLTLPVLGGYGSTITWASSNTSYINTDGTVTRPSYATGDAYVTLTATITKGESSNTKTFYVTVKKSEVITDEDSAVADSSALAITYASGDYYYSVTQNISLPVTGTYGSTTSWASSNTAYVGNDGTVTRPSYSTGDVGITLTATTTTGDSSRTRYFYLTIKRSDIMTDEDCVVADTNALQVSYASGDYYYSVTQNITLPAGGSNGSTITWSSGDEGIIGTTGAVTRPNYKVGNKYVEITATITKGSSSRTKTFGLTVIKAESEYLAFNGHYYRVIDKSINWNNAKTESESLTYNGQPGYLATVTSAEENEFIVSMTNSYYHWLGGIQPDGSSEPAGGWSWVTGENWSYSNWNPGEPNNSGGENALMYNTYSGGWNDYNGANTCYGYIVEFDSANPQVMSADPTDGAVDVEQGKAITLHFDKAIVEGDAASYGSISLKDTDDNSIALLKSITGSDMTITPDPYLAFGKTYTLTIPANAVKSAAGEFMASDYTLSFTTMADYAEFDGHHYRLFDQTVTWEQARLAAEAQTYNGIHGHLATVTSEAENNFIKSLGSVQYHFIGGLQPYGSFEPRGNWQWITGESSDYTNWSSGQPDNHKGSDSRGENALEYYSNDGSWNDLSSANVTRSGYIVEFDSTVKPAVPAVTGTNPADGGTGFDQDEQLEITFNVGINKGSAFDGISLVDSEGNPVAFAANLNGEDLIIKPDPFLGYNTLYTVTIPAGAISNLVGDELAAEYSFSFTSAEKWDVTAPQISSVTPATGITIGGDRSERITVHFTENDNLAATRAIVEVSADGVIWSSATPVGPINYGLGGYFYLDWSLSSVASGEYMVRVTLTDRSGNSSSRTVNYNVDRTAPVKVQNVDAQFESGGINVSWDVSAEADVIYYNVYRQIAGEGDFSLLRAVYGRSTTSFVDTYGLQAGKTYNYMVAAMDKFYQVGPVSDQASIEVATDMTSPVILGILPAEGSIIGPTSSIVVRAQDNFILSSIKLQYSSDDGVSWNDIDTIATRDNATFNLNLSVLSGTIKIRAIATDFIGNVSDGTPVRSYTLDAAGPEKVQGLTLTGTHYKRIP
jgi:hypothetical protein